MLHYEAEIQAFLKAKQRIEALGESHSIPMNVGAFLFFVPSALKEANVQKQIENQRKYELPIIHAQSSFQAPHNLFYSRHQDCSLDGQSDFMERVIEQTQRLKQLDPSGLPADVDLNVGLYSFRDIPEPNADPAHVLPLDVIVNQREALLQRFKSRFGELRDIARENGLGLVLENAITSVFVPHPTYNKRLGMYFYAFNDINSLRKISGDSLALDIAHWAATESAPGLFERNKAFEYRDFLFAMDGITSWDEYKQHHPALSEHSKQAKVFHFSNATGLGVYLEGDLEAKWGDVGTVEGIVPRQDFRTIIDDARENGKPVIIEVDYDIKNIPVNQFREADKLLDHILT